MATAPKVNVFGIFKRIYRDEYQWALVKSVGLFLLGVRIAQEFTGMEVMPAIQA